MCDLLQKIVKSGHVAFFASMLSTLLQVKSEKNYLCAVLLLILVVSACGSEPTLITAVEAFL